MNCLSKERQVLILKCLLDGCSIRTTSRITGHARNTISALMVKVGKACIRFHDKKVRNLPSNRIQVDEMWGFCGCKDKALGRGARGLGSVWTWIAFDPASKMAVSWRLGKRTEQEAKRLMYDLSERIIGRLEMSSDGLSAYAKAVENTFGDNIDFGMVVKQYEQNRYKGSLYRSVVGCPKHISTSLIERFNLTIRQCQRRWTRKTHGFSKKYDNMRYALAIFMVYYNFVRPHMTLRASPAMEIGIENRLWDVRDMLTLD
ncbi:MAG: IS1 family transposase [Rhodospirillales bacterium]|nr:IS1 family transposase [Rhodospirillales bacterium]